MDDSQRIDNCNRIRKKLEIDGYCSNKCTISMIKANVMAVVTSIPVAVLCVVLFLYITPTKEFRINIWKLLIFILVMFASIFVHEFLHGLTWCFNCKNHWQSIYLGVIWKKLTPYCYCMEPLNFGQYILGGLMPFIVLGLGMFTVAIITRSLFFLMLSIFNIIGAGGDITIALMLLKHRNAIIIDHPTECGFWAFNKKEV